MSSGRVPVLLPDVVGYWRRAIEALPADHPPCRHLTPERWGEWREVSLDFIDRFGARAHALGWTSPHLFGVHPRHGTLTPDRCGALMLGFGRADAIEAHRIVFARGIATRDQPGQVWGPPVWEFAARAWR